MEIYNKAENGLKVLPDKTYDYSLLTAGAGTGAKAPGSTTKGITFNESTYTDTSIDSNRWVLEAPDGLIEGSTDYGFGTIDSEEAAPDREIGKGYITKYSPQNSWNKINLDNLISVEGSRINKPDEIVSLYIQPSDEITGVSSIYTSNYTSSSRHPYFTFYYFDKKPTIEDFEVKPNEEDPFYPTFSWSVADDDLWYGFLQLSNQEIKHQYENAVAHIPLNESDGNAYIYKYDGTNNGKRVGADDGEGLTTVEGLAGNAFRCNGGSDDSYLVWNDGRYSQPTDSFSLVVHVTCDSIAATRYILSKRGEFEVYIDTSGNINTTLHYDSSGNSVNLKSTTLVNTDGETPTNIILTFDASLATNNVKLFINGKLEDQSGLKTASGSVNNWKVDGGTGLGVNINNDSSSKLTIGIRGHATGGTPTTDDYSGTIEEVVLYNTVLYPVVPQTGILNIYKPIRELAISNIASGITNVARLFIKDYHNIRGTLSNDVASSSMVSFRKSGLGLKTDV
jgi:hypothetical protein